METPPLCSYREATASPPAPLKNGRLLCRRRVSRSFFVPDTRKSGRGGFRTETRGPSVCHHADRPPHSQLRSRDRQAFTPQAGNRKKVLWKNCLIQEVRYKVTGTEVLQLMDSARSAYSESQPTSPTLASRASSCSFSRSRITRPETPLTCL